MILLIDIGNTHTHLGLGSGRKILKSANLKTADLVAGTAEAAFRRFVGRRQVRGACFCSVRSRRRWRWCDGHFKSNRCH